EQVAAAPEPQWNARPEALVGLRPERGRLTREPAGDRRAPLLANPARLDARGARADPRPLEDRDARTAFAERAGDRQTDHAGPDHGDLGHAGSLTRMPVPRKRGACNSQGRRAGDRPREE